MVIFGMNCLKNITTNSGDFGFAYQMMNLCAGKKNVGVQGSHFLR